MFSIVRGIMAYLAIIGLACQAQADDFTNRPWLAVASVCEDSTKTVEEWLGLPGPTERWCQTPSAKPDRSRLWVPRYAYFDVVSVKYVKSKGWVTSNVDFEGFFYIPTNRSGNEIMDMFFQDDMRERFPLLFSARNEQLELATPLELYRVVDAENPVEVPNVALFARQVLKQVELKDIKAGESPSCIRFRTIRQYEYIVDKATPSFLRSVQCASSPDIKLVKLWNCTNSARLPPSIFGDRDKLWERKGQEESGRIRGRLASINDFASSFPR